MSTHSFNFGQKHLDYMKRCLKCTINVAEGAVRAGKTIDNVYAFGLLLENSPDKYHLATGATASSAKITIADCNGLGLEKRFENRMRWTRYKGCDALVVKTASGEKVILFAGGKNADSYKKIRGNSYGMWIATEINLHHTTMIREAFNRQLAAKDRRVFWDLNPSSPGSEIYTEYIDKYAVLASSGKCDGNFYNYAHFTIFDNPTVSEERLAEIKSQYEFGSVWYRRDILGERCSAEGLVYPTFARKREKLVLPAAKVAALRLDFITIGVDFGGNRSKTTFVACGFLRDGGICILKDHAIEGGKGEIDPMRVNREFAEFVSELRDEFRKIEIRYAFCDSESQYLINGLRGYMKSIGETLSIAESAKKRIKDRIDCENLLMAQDRFFIAESSIRTQRGFAEAVWDKDGKDDVRLDNFTSDIDILDAVEYSFERYMGKLVKSSYEN